MPRFDTGYASPEQLGRWSTEAVVVFVFAMRSSRFGRLALKRTIQLPFLGPSGIFTIGELMMLGATTAMASPHSLAL